MKNLIKSSLLLCAIGLTLHAQAQPRANTWYGKVDAGGSMVSDTEIKDLFGYQTPNAKVSFDPGARFGVGLGYNVTEWFAAEAEVGVNWNEIDKIEGAQHADARLINAPFTFNAKLQLPNPSIVRPYIGAGIGGASSVFDIDEIVYGPVRVSGSASDITFVWQGFAGVQFQLAENMSLGVEYRYVWTEAPDFDIDWGWYWNTWDHQASFGDIETHSVSLSFQYQF